MLLTIGLLGCACRATAAAVRITGQVQAGGGAARKFHCYLWAASASEPRQLAQTQTNSHGWFELSSQDTIGTESRPVRSCQRWRSCSQQGQRRQPSNSTVVCGWAILFALGHVLRRITIEPSRPHCRRVVHVTSFASSVQMHCEQGLAGF